MFSSDEEALEAVKNWWKDNGAFIIAGLVIGVAAIAGWRFWQASLETQATEAASLYEQASLAASAGDREQILVVVDQLQADYRRSAYASQASLQAAAMMVQEQDLEGAAEQLSWVVDNSRDSELVKLARVRLARVHVALDDPDAALAVLDISDPGRFAPLFDEARGDALVAAGDPAAAREAYASAMAADDDEFSVRPELELKYHDLAGYED